jgi:protein-tyrosine phosphatase
MAEGILQKKLKDNHLDNFVSVDSCGFEAFHLEEPPYYMAAKTAKKHGIDIEHQRQRLLSEEDFDTFDKIYVMDSYNYQCVKQISRNDEDMNKVDYLRNLVYPGKNQHVPDPWGGTEKDYEHAFQLIDEACDILIEKIKNKNLDSVI